MDGKEMDFKIWHKQMSRWWRTQQAAANRRRSLTENITEEENVEMKALAEQILENLGTAKAEPEPKTTKLTPKATQASAKESRSRKEHSSST
jgi:hypothetical protein